MSSDNRIGRIALLAVLPLAYTAIPWVLALALTLSLGLFMTFGALVPELHAYAAVFTQILIFGVSNHVDRGEAVERRLSLWGRLPLSRRDLGWAQVGTVGIVALLGAACAATLMLWSRFLGHMDAFQYAEWIVLFGLALLAIRFFILWLEGVATSWRPLFGKALAILGIVVVTAPAVLVFLRLGEHGFDGMPLDGRAFAVAGASALIWMLFAAGTLEKRPDLRTISVFHQLPSADKG